MIISQITNRERSIDEISSSELEGEMIKYASEHGIYTTKKFISSANIRREFTDETHKYDRVGDRINDRAEHLFKSGIFVKVKRGEYKLKT